MDLDSSNSSKPPSSDGLKKKPRIPGSLREHPRKADARDRMTVVSPPFQIRRTIDVRCIGFGRSHTGAAALPAAPGPARSADGDYKSANVQSSQTRDSDGDYKPLSSSAAAQSSAGVQRRPDAVRTGSATALAAPRAGDRDIGDR